MSTAAVAATARTARRDLHNATVDERLAAAGRCGTLHLASGRHCLLPARHRGACRFVADPAPALPTQR